MFFGYSLMMRYETMSTTPTKENAYRMYNNHVDSYERNVLLNLDTIYRCL